MGLLDPDPTDLNNADQGPQLSPEREYWRPVTKGINILFYKIYNNLDHMIFLAWIRSHRLFSYLDPTNLKNADLGSNLLSKREQ